MRAAALTQEHRARIGAAKLGIPIAEYQARRADGLKWCFGCRSWKLSGAFHQRVSAVDGLNNECRACVNPRARAAMQRLAAERKAVALALDGYRESAS